MKKAEIPIRNLTVEVEMEVRDKQKVQSKIVDLLNRESVSYSKIINPSFNRII